MDTRALMPHFEPSPAAQKLIDWSDFKGNYVDLEKIELYQRVWRYKDYPKTRDKEVEGKVLLHIDVMDVVPRIMQHKRVFMREMIISLFFLLKLLGLAI